MQQNFDIGTMEREAILIVADVLHHAACNLGNQLAVHDGLVTVILEKGRLAASFAGDDDLVRRGQGLASEAGIDKAVISDPELDVVLNERIQDRIGNLIGDLVRMSFGDRLTGEKVTSARH